MKVPPRQHHLSHPSFNQNEKQSLTTKKVLKSRGYNYSVRNQEQVYFELINGCGAEEY